MNEIIRIFKMGYFEAIKDVSISKKNKKYKLKISKETKSKIYDLGYVSGYNDYIKYIKNSL